MGSDLYLAESHFRPGKPRVRWLRSGNILVEVEEFRGWHEIYRGSVTPEIKQVLRGLRVRLPERQVRSSLTK